MNQLPKHLQPANAGGTAAPMEGTALVNQLLGIAREAAAAGAAVLAERGRSRVDADTKSAAGDWVTDYDRRAETAVRDVIAAARPNDSITGEEYGRTVPHLPSGYRWSIDPLDGTANFVRGIVYYCTSVAVYGPDPAVPVTGRWLAAAINAPALVLGCVRFRSLAGRTESWHPCRRPADWRTAAGDAVERRRQSGSRQVAGHGLWLRRGPPAVPGWRIVGAHAGIRECAAVGLGGA